MIFECCHAFLDVFQRFYKFRVQILDLPPEGLQADCLAVIEVTYEPSPFF